MAGVDWASGFLIRRSELAREREPERPSDGGGDLRRGEMGQWGVLSTGAVPAVLAVRDGLTGSAEEVVEGWGMLVDDRAR
jgi:hypothetical protein